MKKTTSISKVWDKVWAGYDIPTFLEKSFETDPWTISHKPLIDKYIKRLDKSNTFLEAGCGLGQWCFYASHTSKINSIGVDVAFDTIQKLKGYCKENHNDLTKFICDDLNNSKLDDNCCDMFISLGVIEHFQNSYPMLHTLYRLLRKKGIGIITVPNSYSIHTITRPLLQLAGSWNIGYEKSICPYTLKKMAKRVGFKVIEFGILPSGEMFGLFLNRLPIIGKYLEKFSYSIEKRQKLFGFISYVVVTKA